MRYDIITQLKEIKHYWISNTVYDALQLYRSHEMTLCVCYSDLSAYVNEISISGEILMWRFLYSVYASVNPRQLKLKPSSSICLRCQLFDVTKRKMFFCSWFLSIVRTTYTIIAYEPVHNVICQPLLKTSRSAGWQQPELSLGASGLCWKSPHFSTNFIKSGSYRFTCLFYVYYSFTSWIMNWFWWFFFNRYQYQLYQSYINLKKIYSNFMKKSTK